MRVTTCQADHLPDRNDGTAVNVNLTMWKATTAEPQVSIFAIMNKLRNVNDRASGAVLREYLLFGQHRKETH